ncbi:hypothetical protein [Neisseria sicca]|uniref:hypothetical protein n=1 Tax=Neisseria sicca TaxID=490 RepID=UPI0028E69113|nr:hypothetical protein [Neisseria sicca]
MATLMQKDALIERVASVLALIARKTDYAQARTPEQTRLVELRQHLYRSKPEELDFEQIAEECNAISHKYSA